MKNLITKGATVKNLELTEAELEKINRYALEPLSAEDVFTFKVAICDNEVDRDFEVFPLQTLEKMAELFVGKPINKDHSAHADNQVARIYETEIVSESGTTRNDESYARLVAHCYMVRNESTKNLISDIRSGIKKEVSVGCQIAKAVCSICGTDNRDGYCKHWHGKYYDGKECYFKLEDPLDAYEVSFVAIPAQPNAGTVKHYTGAEGYPEDEVLMDEKAALIDTELEIAKADLFIRMEENDYEQKDA